MSRSDEARDRVMHVDPKGLHRTVRRAVPATHARRADMIVGVSPILSLRSTDRVVRTRSRVGMNAFRHMPAGTGWNHGMRRNLIMPALTDTPVPIGCRARRNRISAEQCRAARGARIPLDRKMGTGRGAARAAMFPASGAARFMTGVHLPMDGGMSARAGCPPRG